MVVVLHRATSFPTETALRRRILPHGGENLLTEGHEQISSLRNLLASMQGEIIELDECIALARMQAKVDNRD